MKEMERGLNSDSDCDSPYFGLNQIKCGEFNIFNFFFSSYLLLLLLAKWSVFKYKSIKKCCQSRLQFNFEDEEERIKGRNGC